MLAARGGGGSSVWHVVRADVLALLCSVHYGRRCVQFLVYCSVQLLPPEALPKLMKILWWGGGRGGLTSLVRDCYAPEAHIMYLIVSSWFLISLVMGGVARAGRFSSLMHLLPHPPQYGPWNLPRGLLYINHLCTYDLHSPVHNVLDAFLGPKWHSPIRSMLFHRAQKTLDFQGPTPSHLPS